MTRQARVESSQPGNAPNAASYAATRANDTVRFNVTLDLAAPPSNSQELASDNPLTRN
jgi:hypothetical protein